MKKKEEEVEDVVIEAAPTTPAPLAYDFGRQDLNEMQAAVNFLLAKGE